MLCLLLAAAVAGGCAVHPPPLSGFLTDYGQLQQDSGDPAKLWYDRPSVRWSAYKKIMLEMVNVTYCPTAHPDIDAIELTMLAGEFRMALQKQFGSQYNFVTKPGPDVLRIRSALTSLRPAGRFTNAASLLLLGLSVDMGEASAEIEVLDSRSNTRLAALVDRKVGNPVSFTGGVTKWDHARTAFMQFAADLQDGLNLATGRQERTTFRKTVDVLLD